MLDRTQRRGAESMSDTQPLRILRAERLLSLRDLARLAGVAPSTIYLIEAGRTRPQFVVIRRLAQALGVDPRAVCEFRRAIQDRARAG